MQKHLMNIEKRLTTDLNYICSTTHKPLLGPESKVAIYLQKSSRLQILKSLHTYTIKTLYRPT